MSFKVARGHWEHFLLLRSSQLSSFVSTTDATRKMIYLMKFLTCSWNLFSKISSRIEKKFLDFLYSKALQQATKDNKSQQLTVRNYESKFMSSSNRKITIAVKLKILCKFFFSHHERQIILSIKYLISTRN